MAETLKIVPYDTTLRDGAQDARARLSVKKKLKIAHRLDQLKFPFIEGGWPGANEIDTDFFRQARGMFENSQFVAFGMTARIGVLPENDDGLNALLEARTNIITIFGKTWETHVQNALRTPGSKNLETIFESIRILKSEGREVIFDAEHWFSGYRENPQYALECLEAAESAGARTLVLCDTNGGSNHRFIEEGVKSARKRFPNAELGIHVHNDSALAVINTIVAVEAGVTQVQGTINGSGERAGNVDLCQILPTAEFKYDIPSGIDLKTLTKASRFVESVNEIPVPDNTPYVGRNSFAHKGGVHQSGQRRDNERQERDEAAYEHVDPASIGNKRIYIMSEQGGSTNVEIMAEKHGFQVDRTDPVFVLLVEKMKQKGVFGDAQEFLLLYETLMNEQTPFDVLESRVIDERGRDPEASIKVRVNGDTFHEAALGKGLINAFDNALRKTLLHKYEEVAEITLVPGSYRVTLPMGESDSAAEVEVYAEFAADGLAWSSRVRGTDQQRAGEDAFIQAYQYYILRRQLGF